MMAEQPMKPKPLQVALAGGSGGAVRIGQSVKRSARNHCLRGGETVYIKRPRIQSAGTPDSPKGGLGLELVISAGHPEWGILRL